MSLATTSCRNDYVGNGSANTYSYTFPIVADSDLVVTVANLASPPTLTTLTLNTDYTVTGVGAAAGGTIVLVNASQAWLTAGNLTTSYKLDIRRVRPITQTTDIRNQGTYYPETIEDTFDELVMISQQIQEQLNRSVKSKVISAVTDPTLPEPIAGDVLAWDPTGTHLVNISPSGSAVNGIPTGGSAGQVLSKIDGTDYNTQWSAAASGSPTTTKGDISVRSATVDTRLPIGSDGQVLTADSAQTLGVKWAAAGTASPLTTKGDLYGFDTANTRLPVGSDGQVLTADSTQAKGVKWAPSASGFANPMTTLGDIIYEDATPTPVRLAGNTTATKKYLSQTGNGSISAAPTWSQPAFSELSGSPTVAQVNPVTGSTGSPTSITAVGGITSTAAVPFQTQFVQGSGGAVTVTANPQISAGTVVGQIMYLMGASDTNTLTLSDGTGLSLNGSMTLYSNSVLFLMWNGTVWNELYRRA